MDIPFTMAHGSIRFSLSRYNTAEEVEYVVKALVTLADFNTRLNSQLAHEEIDTLGGLVMSRLGHVPRRGEKIDIDNWRFEVLRADSRRVYLLKVTPVEQADRQQAK